MRKHTAKVLLLTRICSRKQASRDAKHDKRLYEEAWIETLSREKVQGTNSVQRLKRVVRTMVKNASPLDGDQVCHRLATAPCLALAANKG